MTDFYSSPRQSYPAPSLRVAASENVDDAARTVVLAYRSDSGPTVLERAVRIARREDAALRTVLYATDSTAGPSTNAMAQTKDLARQLVESGVEFELQRADNDVASQILGLAEEFDAEMIVMSSRRRSPVMKLFLGSSAQRVILEAECPVLMVK